MILIGDNRCFFCLRLFGTTSPRMRSAWHVPASTSSLWRLRVSFAHKGAPLLWQAMWRPLLTWVGGWRIGSFTLWRWDWPLLRRTWSWFVGGMKRGPVGMPVWHQALGWEWHSSTGLTTSRLLGAVRACLFRQCPPLRSDKPSFDGH